MHLTSLLILAASLSFLSAQKPDYDVAVNERRIEKGIELTYTLINNTGRAIRGVEVSVQTLDNSGSSAIKVIEFPDGTNTQAGRIPLPGSSTFTSTTPNFRPKIQAKILSITLADGSEWRPSTTAPQNR